MAAVTPAMSQPTLCASQFPFLCPGSGRTRRSGRRGVREAERRAGDERRHANNEADTMVEGGRIVERASACAIQSI